MLRLGKWCCVWNSLSLGGNFERGCALLATQSEPQSSPSTQSSTGGRVSFPDLLFCLECGVLAGVRICETAM